MIKDHLGASDSISTSEPLSAAQVTVAQCLGSTESHSTLNLVSDILSVQTENCTAPEIALPRGLVWDSRTTMSMIPPDLTQNLWPNYMTEESDIPGEQIEFSMSAEEFHHRFPVWAIRESEQNEVIAYISAIRLFADLDAADLPEEGWSFAANSYAAKTQANCLCLLAANVNHKFRRLGLASILISKAKIEAKKMGFHTVIAPVRPNGKAQYPSLSLKDYLQRKREDGGSIDPWVRTHLRAGGELRNICSKSVVIRATLAKWKTWTGIQFASPGKHELSEGLSPLEVDLEQSLGVYQEPNVWISHRVT